MRTTIDVPDSLFRRAKARAAVRGVKLRALFTEALETYLAGEGAGGGEADGERVPAVRAEDLAAHADGSELRRAYPRGYRITGPLVPGAGDGPVTARRVAEAERALDREEMEADAGAG